MRASGYLDCRAAIRTAAAVALLCLGITVVGQPTSPTSHGDTVRLDELDLDGFRAKMGAFEATFLGDLDHIAVLQVTGNYDRDVDGTFNVDPRFAVGEEFYRTHPDDYDFLFIFTTFEFETGSALAFHFMVRNDVEGIGAPIFDLADLVGSDGQLRGVIDMAALSRYVTQPLDPGFETTLGTMAHEVMHQWCCRSTAQSGTLLGLDNAHWSFLLDTDASLMYGADWRDLGDGSFSAEAVRRFYSPLDLYLAGFYDEQEVAPFLRIENPGVEPAQLPPPAGTVITGTSTLVTIGDVIGADGPRLPAAVDAPKDFRAAFLLLKRPEDPLFDRDLAAIGRLREQFANRFSMLTGGRGIMRVLPRVVPEGDTGAPTGTDGGEVRPPGAFDLADALAWLRARQTPDGFWEDHPGTRLRDTTVALETLAELDPEFTRAGDVLVWLEQQQEVSTDYLARAARALAAAGADSGPLTAELVTRQNSDGGWGIDADHASDPLDTALAVAAAAASTDPAGVEAAVQYLSTAQGPDGGWSHVPGVPSRTGITTAVLRALVEIGRDQLVAPAAVSWLASKQNGGDGGFGDSPSTIHDTANVLATLASLGAGTAIDVTSAEMYLRSRQGTSGDWAGSVYATARAIQALEAFNLPDLAFAEPVAAVPEAPRDGEPVDVVARVTNNGLRVARASVLRLYEGDPAAGVVVMEQAVPELEPGDTVLLTLAWDSTDRAGSHTLSLRIDADGAVREANEDDNLASVQVTVSEAPAGPDLAVASGEITVSPAAPNTLPTELAISALVRNFGRSDATNAVVRLWLGEAQTGTLVGEQPFPRILQRTSVVANFTYQLTSGDAQTFTVEVPGVDGEADLTNNLAARIVTPTPSIDFAVGAADLTVSQDPVVLGTNVVFDVTLRNRGTVSGPPVEVVFAIDDGTTAIELDRRSLLIAGGDELQQSIGWFADLAGDLTFVVDIDGGHLVAEIEEGNNRAELAFTATELTAPDFEIALEAPAADPRDGERLELSATVVNRGGVTAPANLVRLYDGDPTAGGVAVAEGTVPALAVGQVAVVVVAWDTFGAAGSHLLTAVVDPDAAVPEVDEDDNTATVAVEVLAPPAGVDLEVRPSGFVFDPGLPAELPVAVAVSISLRNLGLTAASQARVVVWDGEPGIGTVAHDQRVDFAARSDIEINFSYPLSRPVAVLTAVLDPDAELVDFDRSNNVAAAELTTEPTIDLEVTAADLELLTTPAFPGADLEFRVTVRNRGTRDLPNSATVRAEVGDGATTVVLLDEPIFLAAGASHSITLLWPANLEGDLELAAEIDGNGVSETDLSNNAAVLPFTVGDFTEPNLMVRGDRVSFDPDPGREGVSLTIDVLVENTGGVAAEGFETSVYDGNPDEGAPLVAGPVVASVAAGATQLVSLTWNRVPDAADRNLFVAVDRDQHIDEVVEDDNLTFKWIEIHSLPDLAVAEAAIALDPSFPRPGETVTATITVTNLGEQGIPPASPGDVAVTIYDADPLAGGQPLAAVQRIEVPGSGTAIAELAFVAGAGGEVTIFAVVNEDGGVEEQTSANNSAERTFAIQEGDFGIDHRYFSPNGDGVLDSVRFVYRLETPTRVEVRVQDQSERTVRSFGPPTIESAGEVEWDGRDDRGRIAPDGSYLLQVVDATGAIAGAATVVLDNDKTGLLRSAGTEFENFVNLTCEVRDVAGASFTEDEQWIYFTIPPRACTTVFCSRPGGDGLHRISTDSFAIEEIYLDEEENEAVTTFAVSESASWVAWNLRDLPPRPAPLVEHLFIARGDGTDRVEIGAGTVGTPDSVFGPVPIGFDRGARFLYYLDDDEIIKAPIDDIQQREVVFTGSFGCCGEIAQLSPDRRLMLIREGFDPYDLSLYDLETGAVTALGSFSNLFNFVEEVQWASDSSRFAFSDGVNLQVFGRGGALEATFEPPADYVLPAPLAEFAGQNTIVSFGAPSWSTLDPELAAIIHYQIDSDFEFTVFEQAVRVDVTTGEVTSVGWTQADTRCFCTYHVSTWDGASWVERGTVQGEADFSPKQFDLSRYLPDADGEYKVRLAQQGPAAAFVDRANLLWGKTRLLPKAAFDLADGRDVASVITQRDGEMLDLQGGEVEIHWPSYGNGRLTLTLWANEDETSEAVGGETVGGLVAGPVKSQTADGLATPPTKEAAEVPIENFDQVFFAPNDAALLLANWGNTSFAHSWAVFLGEPDPTGVEVPDPENRWQRVFQGFDNVGSCPGCDDNASIAPSGRMLIFESSDDTGDSESLCVDHRFADDQFLWRSLMNLTADLRIRRSVDPTNVLLEGTAADINFKSYHLEYTRVEEPEAWKPVSPARSVPAFDQLFQTWVPPAPGSWLVRLSVFDLAGNVRRTIKRVSAPDFPQITDVFVSPELFSPNFDGVLDNTFVHYQALEPVVVEIQVLDFQGTVVAVLVEESLAAGEVMVPWDGRSLSGAVVSDGPYTLLVQGSYELPVTVDTSPLEVGLTLSDPYRITVDQEGREFFHLLPSLSYGIGTTGPRAVEIAEEVVERGEGAAPAAWQLFDRLGPHQQRGDLTFAEFTDGNFRVRASDHAGNLTVATSGLGAEQLMLLALGDHGFADDGGFEPIDGNADLLGLAQAIRAGEVYSGFTTDTGELRFRLAETLRGEISRLVVEHRQPSEADPDPPWMANEIDAFYPPDSIAPLGTPPPELFEVVWDTLAGVAEFDRDVRIVAEDPLGVRHVTATFALRRSSASGCPEVSFEDQLRLDDLLFESDPEESCYDGPQLLADIEAMLVATGVDADTELLPWGHETIDGDLEDLTLLLRSAEDPAYAVWTDVPLLAQRGDAFIFLPDPALVTCVKYFYEFSGDTPPELDPATGIIGPRTLLDEGEFRTPCLGLGATLVADLPTVCGEPSPERVTATIVATDETGNTPLQDLSFVRRLGDDGELLLSVSAPVSDLEYEVVLDVSLYEEGIEQFEVRVANVDGQQRIKKLELNVDRVPPTVEITVPEEGAMVCGFNNQFEIEGVVGDQAPSISAGPRLGDFSGGGSVNGDVPLPSWSISNTFCVLDGCLPQPLDPSDATRFEESGVLGEVFFVDGPISHQIKVWDRGGNLTCLDRSYVVDAFVPKISLDNDFIDFSPNGDGVQDQVRMGFETDEPQRLDAEVWDAVLDPFFGCVVDGPLLRTLADNLAIFEDGALFWDGRDDDGGVVPDGWYLVEVRNRDACGNEQHQTFCRFVDTVPPQVDIVYPTLEDVSLPVMIDVQMSVLGGGSIDLSFGESHDPVSWHNLRTGPRGFDGLIHAEWNTFGMEGDWTLRLRAVDLAGNRAEVREPVTLPVRADLITYIDAVPELFSPNGDSRREDVALRFGLLAAADVEFTVEDLAGQQIAVLAAERFSAGGSSSSWSGQDGAGQQVADGRYRAVLTATLASDPNFVQEEAITFELDATPPTVAVIRPENGFSTGGGNVVGTVEDTHLTGYSVFLTTGGGNPVELGSGEANVSGAGLAPLGELAEGDYQLLVVADDAGESRTELTVSFTVDQTPPDVAIAAPAEGAVLGAVGGLAEVLGSVTDEHLESWQLTVGEGEEPAVFVPLASGGEEGPSSELLAAWDLASWPDGVATLRLSATDKAGNEAEVRRMLTVDNTPPSAVLSSPADGGFVTAPIPITGTATDVHFVEYRLEVAAATAPGEWLELHLGTAGVASSVLHDWQALPPDGEYALRLVVTDIPGNVGQAQIAVSVDITPPPAPIELTATVEGQRDGRLNWTPSAAPDVAGYRVYRAGQAISAELVEGTTYLDPSLAEGTYVYRVTALDDAGNESESSNEAELEIDLSAPEARIFSPADEARVNGLVDIEGTARSQDFHEYRLYTERLDGPGGRQLLRNSPVPTQAGLLGQWNSLLAPEESRWRLSLEAEDLAGNVATDEVEVVVDNQPPDAPIDLTATLSGSRDIDVAWTASASPDVIGYLLFRDGRIANANGPVIGELTPFILTATHYLDADLPDGTFTYLVHAVDQAGNLSDPSNEDDATVETRTPRAVIVDPEPFHRFEADLFVAAETEDQDVAQVQFQYRPTGTSIWLDLGAADLELPWQTILDPVAAGFDFGNVQLRAVATDTSNNTDPSPSAITVEYADLTPPTIVLGVATQVDGGDVIVTWTAGGDADLTGYHVYRSTQSSCCQTRLTASTISATIYLDSGVDDRTWYYWLKAVDEQGNESAFSEPAEAIVFTPVLEQPYTPTPVLTSQLEGLGLAGYQATVELSNAAGNVVLPPIDPDAAGAFAQDLDLEIGTNTITVVMADADGNRSKTASADVLAGLAPSRPQNLAASVAGFDVDLTWDPNPEVNLLGYRLWRNDLSVLDAEVADFNHFAASSQASPSFSVNRAFDGNPSTFWWPNSGFDEWLEVGWPGQRIIAGVEIDWWQTSSGSTTYAARDFRIQGLYGGVWVTVARVVDNFSARNTLIFDLPYRTDRLRLWIDAPVNDFSRPLRVLEMRVREVPLLPVTPTATTDVAPDGFHVYTLSAVDDLGFHSVPSEPTQPLAVGDVVPPDPPVLAARVVGDADVELTWTAVDAVRYDLYRDGIKFAEHDNLASLLLLDEARPNGTYRYIVRALDAAGNVSEPSNEEQVTIAVEPPPMPIDLTVTAPPEGRALDASWLPGEGSDPAGYILFRSTVAGGPYQEVESLDATSYRDQPLTNGVRYYYVVVAFDQQFNQSGQSNEASGVPENTLPALAPALHFPTVPERVLVTEESSVTIIGRGAPNVTVTLNRDSQGLDTVRSLGETEIETCNFTNGSGRLIVATDGRYVWNSDFGDSYLFDFETCDTRYFSLGDGFGRWLPDNQHVIFTNPFPGGGGGGGEGLVALPGKAGGDSEILRVSAVDGTVELVTTVELALITVPAPAGDVYAVLGERGGEEGIFLFDSVTEVWTLVADLDVDSVDAETLAWSPDGSRLAWLDQSDDLIALHLASGTLQIIESLPFENIFDFSADGSQVVFRAFRDGSSDIWIYNFDESSYQRVSTGFVETPQLAPAGRAVAFADSNELIVHDLVSGNEQEIYNIGFLDSTMEWTASGHIFLIDNFELLRLWPLGRFQFDNVGLLAGDNVFTAASVGVESEPIVIATSTGSALPDYAVELAVIPSVMVSGETLRATATVASVGEANAPAVELAMAIVGPDDFFLDLTSGELVGPLAAGGRQAVARETPLDAAPGIYAVVASVDPLGELVEASEANNLAAVSLTVVAEGAGPLLTVATDQPLYLPGEALAATVEILGTSDDFDGLLEISIEDDAGFVVHTFAGRPVVDLAFGERRSEIAMWNVGSTFAATYLVRARLLDTGRGLAAEAFAPFEIFGQAEITAAVTSDAASYPRGAAVTLVGDFAYQAGNLVITGSEAVLTVFDAADLEMVSWTQPLGTLLPGAQGALNRIWASGDAAAGVYRAVFEIRRGVEVLAGSEALFELGGEVVFSQLSASKTAALAEDRDGDGAVSPGDRVRYLIILANSGTGPATGISLLDAVPSGTTLVAGSITTNLGSVDSSDPIEVAIVALDPGAAAEITFEVDLDADFPEGVGAITNQATIDADGVDGLLSDDPATPQPADPTVTPVISTPRLVASKVDFLAEDRDGNGLPGPGDVLRYEITLANIGNASASTVRFEDSVPLHTMLVPGSLTVALGTIEDGDEPGDTRVEISLAELRSAETETISFEVEIADLVPVTLSEIRNQGFALSAELAVVLSDDPDTVEAFDATITEIVLPAMDYGDAPEPEYPTVMASDGARHLLGSGIYLGSQVDAELDGQPDAAAVGDDVDGVNDDDGVTFVTELDPGTIASVDIEASAPCLLSGWIDFNGNGDWRDDGERIFLDVPLVAGINQLTFPVPATATPNITTFARFRVSTVGGLSFDGKALDGEVEDYEIGTVPIVLQSFSIE